MARRKQVVPDDADETWRPEGYSPPDYDDPGDFEEAPGQPDLDWRPDPDDEEEED